MMYDAQIVDALGQGAQRLDEDARGFEALVDRMQRARFVLLGESTHGTHEFYRDRAEITRQLIERHGFDAVAIEGDWPDSLRVNRYVHGRGDDASAADALSDFQRFPTWMWRNHDVVEFVDWLRDHNAERGTEVGFYGLDLYSLHRSMNAVLAYLEGVDPTAAAEARQRYSCFDHSMGSPELYGIAAARKLKDCEDDVVAQLVALRARHAAARGLAEDEAFFAEQNALVVKNAEQYYRLLYAGRQNTWNLRDGHMVDTLDALSRHIERRKGRPAKIVVWAHNSHVGDARATEFAERGEIDLGQLVRGRFGADQAFLLGQTTWSGTVTCASSWDGEIERKQVVPGRPDAWEGLLHQVEGERFWVDCRDPSVRGALEDARLERMIGVIYQPQTERQSHYVGAKLGQQFDALIHTDVTQAVEPLDQSSMPLDPGEVPETFPSAF
jgi:erythromycin esterase-like protein